MIVNKAYQYRIYPTKALKVFFAQTFDCNRYIYNVSRYDKIPRFEDLGLMLRNTSAQYKAEDDFLKRGEFLGDLQHPQESGSSISLVIFILPVIWTKKLSIHHDVNY